MPPHSAGGHTGRVTGPPTAAPAPWAAIVLAGGAARRMGGVDKTMLTVGGRTLLDTALAAVAACAHVIVVGPARPSDHDGVVWTREDPPRSGPAAALHRGLAMLDALDASPPDGADVAVLAADLPGVTPATIARLAVACRPAPAGTRSSADAPDGAVLVDGSGRPQLVIGVWRRDRLASAIASRADWAGVSLRELLAPLVAAPVPAVGEEASDVDTPADAHRWQAGQPGVGSGATAAHARRASRPAPSGRRESCSPSRTCTMGRVSAGGGHRWTP